MYYKKTCEKSDTTDIEYVKRHVKLQTEFYLRISDASYRLSKINLKTLEAWITLLFNISNFLTGLIIHRFLFLMPAGLIFFIWKNRYARLLSGTTITCEGLLYNLAGPCEFGNSILANITFRSTIHRESTFGHRGRRCLPLRVKKYRITQIRRLMEYHVNRIFNVLTSL